MDDRNLAVIIGAQKCGTSTLYEWLKVQPGFSPSTQKELHFFDFQYAKGVDYYMSQFVLREGGMLLESSPMYVFHPAVPRRLSETFPGAKLIVILRNPLDRAWSHYKMNVRRGLEKYDFQTAVRLEIVRIALSSPDRPESRFQNYSYVLRGHYAHQLKRWFRYFSRDQFFIAVFEDFFKNPGPGMQALCEFLKTEFRNYNILQQAFNVGEGESISELVRTKFEGIFAREVERLRNLVTPDFGTFESWRIS
ncbi:MAG: sulfotransferase domain-containing protein [Thermaurantimonas sp.]